MSDKKFVVVCLLPNASTLINDVKFELASGKAFSEPVDEATAERFGAIEGYEVTEVKEKAPAKKPAAKTEPPKDGADAATAGATADAAKAGNTAEVVKGK